MLSFYTRKIVRSQGVFVMVLWLKTGESLTSIYPWKFDITCQLLEYITSWKYVDKYQISTRQNINPRLFPHADQFRFLRSGTDRTKFHRLFKNRNRVPRFPFNRSKPVDILWLLQRLSHCPTWTKEISRYKMADRFRIFRRFEFVNLKRRPVSWQFYPENLGWIHDKDTKIRYFHLIIIGYIFWICQAFMSFGNRLRSDIFLNCWTRVYRNFLTSSTIFGNISPVFPWIR